MANKNPEQKAKAEATAYDRAYLIDNAAAFNVAPEIVAGALHDKETATQDEAAEAIKTFLETPKKGTEDKEPEKGVNE